MRIGWTGSVLIGALGLASCGSPSSDTSRNEGGITVTITDGGNLVNVVSPDNAANAVAATDTAKADEVAIRALIDRVYESNEDRGGTDPFTLATPDLRAAHDRAVKVHATLADTDLFCDCQDSDGFQHRINAVQVAGDFAHASVEVNPGFQAGWHKKQFDFVRTSKGWLIDDVDGKKADLRAARAVPVENSAEAP